MAGKQLTTSKLSAEHINEYCTESVTAVDQPHQRSVYPDSQCRCDIMEIVQLRHIFLQRAKNIFGETIVFHGVADHKI